MKKNYFLAILLFCCTLLSSAQDNKTIISNYISTNLSDLQLSSTDLTDFKILSVGTLSNKEYKVAYLQQEVYGIPVAKTHATVLLKDDQIIKFNHVFVSDIRAKITQQSASLSAKQAANQAISLLGLSDSKKINVVDYKSKTDIKKSELANTAIEAPLYYLKDDNGTYIMVYEIVIKESNSHWWVTKINANTGNIEDKADAMISCNFEDKKVTDATPINHGTHSHKYKTPTKINAKATKDNFQFIKKVSTSNMMVTPIDGSSYNAYPLGVESPFHGERAIITDPAAIASLPEDTPLPSPFGWHDFEGARTTKTLGNNVSAYEDTGLRNGPIGDGTSFATELTPGSLNFDYPLDLGQHPHTYQKAAIVNLFVWNNYMHDISYAYGFDETNGNFQDNAYGRFDNIEGGGAIYNDWDRDEVRAEAQDGDGINNANFGALGDSFVPRMQMFLWGASPFGDFFHVTAQSSGDTDLVGSYYASRFPFYAIPRTDTPDNLPFEVALVLVQDDMTPYTGLNDGGTAGESLDPSDGCTAYTAASAAAVAGNIAVIRRGACTFVEKITLAQENGALGVVLVNNSPEDGPVNGGGEPYIEITIPAVSVSFEVGEALIERMETETITASLRDDGPPSDLIKKDGDLDQGIIAHEYGHGISTRLVGGRKNSTCLLSITFEEEMGEGWSDFFGLFTTARSTDVEADYRGIGTYVQFQGTDGLGIRPARYSTDFAINDYTYEHLPEAERGLTVPHGIGFVWATILWDMYWEMVDKYGFDQDLYYGTGGNNMTMQLVMDGLKLSTCGNVGFVDGRDAILAADAAIYGGANECLIRTVFARRGVGYLAQQGSSESREDQVPDFFVGDVGVVVDCEESQLSIDDKNRTIFIMYPNPADTEVYIRNSRNIGSAVYKIIDINGRVLETNQLSLVNLSKIEIGHLSAGMYVISLKTESGQVYTQKIIKN
ncbi:hypothetical protein BTO04_06630 [Polaribacter sp. SA4-10]|uniref:T9SS-dependent M36 family metallopeptidase n=1 Tax=Polaribacter sp. SA4-10 TaxID=754397 RepID=UPI000B3C99CA|nr:T9SS-dependent M36 family metallopeptidase [Polaribacter sp. SA4-10]ARV06397.1 hypothetical protein BTO04_06630 [Polaribacter sp. SA4-10]